MTHRRSKESVFLCPQSTNINQRDRYCFCTGLKAIVLEDCERGLTCDAGIYHNKYDAFWGTSPQYLYIGRDIPELLFYGNGGFEGINYDNITTISIGQYVTGVNITNVNLWDSLKTLYCLSNNPPAVSFGTKTYANAKLYVPSGTKERYVTANGWNNFFQIEEMDIDITDTLLAKLFQGIVQMGFKLPCSQVVPNYLSHGYFCSRRVWNSIDDTHFDGSLR